jgi:hypothetical protein
MSSQQRAPHRIHVGKRLEFGGKEAILRQPSRIVTEVTTASVAMSFKEIRWEVFMRIEKRLSPCEECCVAISSITAVTGGQKNG